MQDIAGKVALVTGAAGGIGRGIARALAAEGARVAIADIDIGGAEATAAELGGDAMAIGIDITDEASWKAAVQAVEARLGPIDILVNNAGVVGSFKPLLDQDMARIRRVMEINFFGAITGIQLVGRGMRQRGHGHIVNTASMSGLDTVPLLSEYSSSKRALIGLSEALRDELAGCGVGVSVLCPGSVATDLSKNTGVQLGDPGLAAASAEMRKGAGRGLDPDKVGPMVVDAIREDRLYILTHPESRARIDKRMEPVYQAFEWFER